MQKYSFAFELGERVNVPFSPTVQGIVTGASAMIGMENQYVVSAMTDEGKSGSVGYGEVLLLSAQQKPDAEGRKAKR